jgi:tripartite-type tricarboxylate transporter receptor subunit TctC
VVSGPDLENFRAGKLVPIAVTCRERMPQLPNVQTMAEAGYPEFSVTGTIELFYPKGVPAPALDRLSKAIEDTKRNPDFLKKLDGLHAQPAPTTTRAEFSKWLDADREFWSRIAKDANVVIDN